VVSNLHIVGASIRAAAFSAIRAGLAPAGWDLYADADLLKFARVERIGQLTDMAPLNDQHRREVPLMYTGGMENQLSWLLGAEAAGPVLSSPAEAIHQVRNPFTLARRLQEVNLPALDLKQSQHKPPRDGRWIIKPTAGVGGRGVALWNESAGDDLVTLYEPHYFQRFAQGEAYSAVFVGYNHPSDVQFLGITRQLIGSPVLRSSGFRWCGCIGPAALPVETELVIRRVGNVVRWKFGLVGLFGCDFVVDAAGVPWLTEVNPRYPASLEVLEVSCGFPSIRAHAAAFGLTWDWADPPFQPRSDGLIAKGVLSAWRDIVFPEVEPTGLATPFELVGRVADVPRPGTRIPAGAPLCTFFVQAGSYAECLQMLHRAACQLEMRLDHATRGNGGAKVDLEISL
jgi:predicted ATP-grasp superfamily ATP-dependent carboligase